MHLCSCPMNAPTSPPPPQRHALSVITPTYNESENIPLLLDALSDALEGIDYEIIVVDDNSPDMTWEIAENYSAQNRRVHVIRRFGESGLSSAVLAGMEASNADVLAVIDADMQHDEKVLPAMLAAIHDGADVAVGSRGVDGGSYGEFGPLRRLISWVAAMIAKVFLRVPTVDPMSGFFAMSRDTFMRMGPHVNPQGFKILLEFIGRREHLKVVEVPYTFRTRTHGETKLSPSVIRSYLLAVAELRLGRAIKGQFFLYSLVGLSGVAVSFAVFTLCELLNTPQFTTGISDWVDPVYVSELLGVGVAIVSNFVLNNYFTFWERRFRGNRIITGFAMFVAVSLLGLIVNLGVFHFMQSTGWGFDLIGNRPAKYAHNIIGALAALVVNYFLNVNYTWSRRTPH